MRAHMWGADDWNHKIICFGRVYLCSSSGCRNGPGHDQVSPGPHSGQDSEQDSTANSVRDTQYTNAACVESEGGERESVSRVGGWVGTRRAVARSGHRGKPHHRVIAPAARSHTTEASGRLRTSANMVICAAHPC